MLMVTTNFRKSIDTSKLMKADEKPRITSLVIKHLTSQILI